MKVYILTFSNTTNVGAALQAYALQKYLQQQGYDAKVIDYQPSVMRERYSLFYQLRTRTDCISFLKALLLGPLFVYRKHKFNTFNRKYIHMTEVCNTTIDIQKLKQPDVYIVGSDQIWNDEIAQWDSGYLLDFEISAKKMSYAASAGKDIFTDKFLERMSFYLQKFDAVSVREFALQIALQNAKIKNVKQVLDPVFLLSKAHYSSIADKPKLTGYILLYELEHNNDSIIAARKLAQKYGLKIVQINRINNRYHTDKLYPAISPTEFLSLVKNAQYVITNSFHAVAFSIIMEKQFWVIKLKALSSRIDSILKIVQLENRIYSDLQTDFSERIDYDKIGKLLSAKREESFEFLKENL